MDLTLVVLAAGMGSRYGGPKQLTGIGPAGETITHYNVYDAVQAGFNRVVYVVRESLRDTFTEQVAATCSQHADFHVVSQDVPGPNDNFPAGLWGTTHAVLSARHSVSGPFAVINADDYYGPDAFRKLAQFYAQNQHNDRCALIGYPIAQTLSEHGPVTRARCTMDRRGQLVSLEELRGVARNASGICQFDSLGVSAELPEETLVSMNAWGLRESLFPLFADALMQFHTQANADARGECLLPETMHQLIVAKETEVQVIETSALWFGLTFAEDLPAARKAIADLSIANLSVANGYPSPLFES